jgi:hypothetical protein
VSSRTAWSLTAAAAIVLLAHGCGRDNGVPADLVNHLARHGIQIRALGSRAPLSSRGGFVTFEHDTAVEAKIAAAFRLERLAPEDPRFSSYAGRIAEKPVALWGIGGRPASLTLENGSQFESLYLLVTEGRSYLFAEYAYG